MKKVYKQRFSRIMVNLFGGVLLSVVIVMILGVWLGPPVNDVVGGAVFLLYLWLVVVDNMIAVHVDDANLTVYKRGRMTHDFRIGECSFRAKTKSSWGDTECYLTVIEPNGKETLVDCELIGAAEFYELLEDLEVVGDRAPAVKLETK